MSETPLGAIFRLQRETIQQTETVAEELIRTPAEVGDLLAEGAGTQRELQEQALELTRQSIHRSLDAAESVAGAGEIGSVRSSIDDSFDALEQQQDELVALVESESDSVSEELLDQLSEQIDLVIELNEQIEQQVTEMLEDVPDDAVPGEFFSEIETQLTAVTEQFEDQLDAVGGFDTASGTEPTEIDSERSAAGDDTDSEE